MCKSALWLAAVWLMACPSTRLIAQQNGTQPKSPFVENGAALKELTLKVATLNSLLKEIDINKLSVQYREGHIIEQHRSLAMDEIKAIILEIDEYFKKGPNLDSTVNLVFNLKDLEGNLDDLGSALTNLVTTDDKSSLQQGVAWAEQVTTSYTDISKSLILLEGRARLTLMMADTILNSCVSK